MLETFMTVPRRDVSSARLPTILTSILLGAFTESAPVAESAWQPCSVFVAPLGLPRGLTSRFCARCALLPITMILLLSCFCARVFSSEVASTSRMLVLRVDSRLESCASRPRAVRWLRSMSCLDAEVSSASVPDDNSPKEWWPKSALRACCSSI